MDLVIWSVLLYCLVVLHVLMLSGSGFLLLCWFLDGGVAVSCLGHLDVTDTLHTAYTTLI